MSDQIKERDLTLVTPAPTDEVRVLRNGRSVRALALSLPTPTAAQEQIDQLRQIATGSPIPYAEYADLPGTEPGNGARLVRVTDDPTPANNGTYAWYPGASGWVSVPDEVADLAVEVDAKASKRLTAQRVLGVMSPFDQMLRFQPTGDYVPVGYIDPATGRAPMVLRVSTGELLAHLSPSNPSVNGIAFSALARAIPPNARLYEVDGSVYPVLANSDGQILFGIDLLTGELIGNFPGGGDGSGGARPDGYVAYIKSGALWAAGGAQRARSVNADSDKTWLSAQTVGSAAWGVYTGADAHEHAAVVNLANGRRYPEGRIVIRTSDGQSNGEGQAGSSRSVVYTEGFGHPARVRMPATAAGDLWLGKATGGGTSVEILSEDITGLTPALSKIAATGSHGTLAVEGMVRRLLARASADADGWVPQVLLWSNSEGGQTIANMLEDAPAGYHYYQNIRTILGRVAELAEAEGRSVVYDWALMDQGESDVADAMLGQKHDTLREQMEEAAQELLGQTEPLRMLSSQMSSFQANKQAVQSILDHGLATAQWGNFWCLGPTYVYPYSSDYLHHTSVGHAMRGEFADAAIEEFERTGYWLPLHMVSAAVTGANEITVTLSEPAVIDAGWLAADIANAGITLGGGTVSAVSVTGDELVITTVGDAVDVTEVRAAYVGHPGSRTEATIPRSTIRSVASIGTWSAPCGGKPMYKPLCHQTITIGA